MNSLLYEKTYVFIICSTDIIWEYNAYIPVIKYILN